MSTPNTDAPSAARRTVTALPIPDPAPVTRATFSSNLADTPVLLDRR
jgi:hypothetical protein